MKASNIKQRYNIAQKDFFHYIIITLIAVTLFSIQPATASSASKINITPSVGFQYKLLSFEQDYPTGLGTAFPNKLSGGIEAQLPVLSLGLTLSMRSKYFLSFFVDDTINEANEDSSVPFTNTTNSNTETETSVQRRDYNFALGYQAASDLALFVGYMRGKTELTPDAQNLNLAQRQSDAGFGQYTQTYREDGFFFGINYRLINNNLGSLSTRVAYALLDGEYTDNYFSQSFRFEGDTKGSSIAIRWTGPLTDKMSYDLNLGYQEFELKGRDISGAFRNNSVITTEEITTLSAGLLWHF